MFVKFYREIPKIDEITRLRVRSLESKNGCKQFIKEQQCTPCKACFSRHGKHQIVDTT